MIREKYKYLGHYVGAEVLIFTNNCDGAEAIITSINEYGNVIVEFNELQYDDGETYSGQVLHPLQVQLKNPV